MESPPNDPALAMQRSHHKLSYPGELLIIRVSSGKRDGLRTCLQERQVGSEVYYPVPIHKQSFYVQDFGYDDSLPVTENAALQDQLSINGRRLVETKYDWQVVLEAMKLVYILQRGDLRKSNNSQM